MPSSLKILSPLSIGWEKNARKRHLSWKAKLLWYQPYLRSQNLSREFPDSLANNDFRQLRASRLRPRKCLEGGDSQPPP